MKVGRNQEVGCEWVWRCVSTISHRCLLVEALSASRSHFVSRSRMAIIVVSMGAELSGSGLRAVTLRQNTLWVRENKEHKLRAGQAGRGYSGLGRREIELVLSDAMNGITSIGWAYYCTHSDKAVGTSGTNVFFVVPSTMSGDTDGDGGPVGRAYA